MQNCSDVNKVTVCKAKDCQRRVQDQTKANATHSHVQGEGQHHTATILGQIKTRNIA